MRTRLLVPLRLRVALTGVVALAGCTTSGGADVVDVAEAAALDAPSDASAPFDAAPESSTATDAALADRGPDVVFDRTGDACPDPFACVVSVAGVGPDSEVLVEYRRPDGSVSDVPCPPVAPECPQLT